MMIRFKIIPQIAAIAFLMIVFSGCGYHIGVRGMAHPQIKSIAIDQVRNETIEPLAGSIMRGQIAAQFQTDGAMELKNLGNSDCVLHAVIRRIDITTIREDSYDSKMTYRPSEFQMTILVEFEVIIPGRGAPLIPKRTVEGTAKYQVFADPAANRQNALKYACYSAAKKIVQYTTEAW